MAGKSTTRVRRRPALAHWVAPHSNHAPPAVGRTRGEIHRGPIGNSRPAARGKTGSIALARAKPVGLAAHRKVASEAEAVVSLVVEEAAGLIASVPAQVAPAPKCRRRWRRALRWRRVQTAVRKECRVLSVEGRGEEGARVVCRRGIHSALIHRHSTPGT